jgi:hypothetical protein
MSDYTAQSFIEACYEKLRATTGAEASMIPRLRTMLGPALESLAIKVALDKRYRNLLRKELGTVSVSNGEADLSGLQSGTQPILLDELAIRTADIRDADGNKLRILADRGSLDNDKPSAFKYGAVEGVTLYTDATGTLTVTANYIETEVENLPTQLIPMLFDEMLSPWMKVAA